MQAFKELYWRYSLFVLILGLGVTIFIELTPFLGGVLGAMTIYVLLRRQMHYLTACRKWRRSLAASLLLGEAVLCFLVPISLIVWMVVNQVQDIALAPESVVEPLKHIAALIHDKTGYNLWQEKNITSLVGVIPRLGQWVLGSIMDFGINIIVLLFVLYFMLIGGLRMEGYCREILPFNRDVGSSVMREVHMIVRSNAIGIPLLAVVQGVVAFVGYLVFNAPSPLFWGVLTCFATIIPIFGTALIWLPLAGYMALSGRLGAGHRAAPLRRAGRDARGQRRAVHHAEEDGRYASAGDDLRRFHRAVALRVHGGDFRAADAGDVRLLRQYLQEEVPRRDVVQAVVRPRAGYSGVARRALPGGALLRKVTVSGVFCEKSL